MSEDNNALPDDDEAQRLLDELEAESKESETESKEPEPTKPKAAKKKAARKKAAPKPKTEPAQESEGDSIVNKTPRVLNIMHVSIAPGDSYTPTEQDAENERFVRKVERAIELGVLAVE